MTGCSSQPAYREEAWLRQKYWDEELSLREIAAEADVSEGTIRRWMDRHDIPRRDKAAAGRVYHPTEWDPGEDWLRQQYVDEGKTLQEIADENGVAEMTVHARCVEYDIERREPTEYTRVERVSVRTAPPTHHDAGYEIIQGRAAYGERYPVHRLAAIAWFGVGAVEGKDVHHENGVRWDNREENLTPLDKAEHGRISATE